MQLTGKKNFLLSRGVIGAIAVIVASAAYLKGYTDVESADIKGLMSGAIAVIGGIGLMFKRFRQTVRGLDWKAAALAGVTAIAGVYVAVTGDKESADAFVSNMNGVIITLGALLSAFGIDVAEKKVGVSGG